MTATTYRPARLGPNGARMAVRRIGLEQRSFWRHRQNAFWAFLLPVILLVVLGETDGHRLYHGMRVVNLEVPGLLTFGLVAATYNNLAVTITTQRETGILKRLRATPLPVRTFIVGQIGSSLVVGCCLTIVFVIASRLLFGISMPMRHAPAFIVTVALAAACFCALGLAATIAIHTAESASPIVNASYIPLALVSGVFFTPDAGTPWLRTITGFMPLRPLTEAVQACFLHNAGTAWQVNHLAVLACWGTAGALLAWRYFRWSPSN